MDESQNLLLSDCLLAWGDDELVLGHRASEWCGHAPILEEDIAFANLALDEIGHAVLWYSLVADLSGEDPSTYPDQLVYQRSPQDFRNVRLVELPRGDWAFSMLRQYLFDAAEIARLNHLFASNYRPLAETAVKIRQEELYHHRHTRAWILRLGQSTEESHNRLQQAVEALWPYTAQIFSPVNGEEDLVAAGCLPPTQLIQSDWEELVLPTLYSCGLEIPIAPVEVRDRREHTSHLKALVADLQAVVFTDPEAEW